MDAIFQVLESPRLIQAILIVGPILLLAAAVDQWRAIQSMREYAVTLGLPLAPPVARLFLAQWIEAMTPTMAGLWHGTWVRLGTRPMWVVPGFYRGYEISIRVTGDRDLVPGLASPPDLIKEQRLRVDGRELQVFTWGSVRMDDIPRYLDAAVAHVKAITPPEPPSAPAH